MYWNSSSVVHVLVHESVAWSVSLPRSRRWKTRYHPQRSFVSHGSCLCSFLQWGDPPHRPQIHYLSPPRHPLPQRRHGGSPPHDPEMGCTCHLEEDAPNLDPSRIQEDLVRRTC